MSTAEEHPIYDRPAQAQRVGYAGAALGGLANAAPVGELFETIRKDNSRLLDLVRRATKIADRISGPLPEIASPRSGGDTITISASLADMVHSTSDHIVAIQAALDRIEAQI